MDTFKQLPINAIMVIYDDVSKVVGRLNARDGINHSETIFEMFQNEELSYKIIFMAFSGCVSIKTLADINHNHLLNIEKQGLMITIQSGIKSEKYGVEISILVRCQLRVFIFIWRLKDSVFVNVIA